MNSTEAIQAEPQSNVIALKRDKANELRWRIIDALTAAGVFVEPAFSKTIYEALEESDAKEMGLVKAVLDMAAENGRSIDPKTHGIIESTIMQDAGSIAANVDAQLEKGTPQSAKDTTGTQSKEKHSNRSESAPKLSAGSLSDEVRKHAQALIEIGEKNGVKLDAQQRETLYAALKLSTGYEVQERQDGELGDLSDALMANATVTDPLEAFRHAVCDLDDLWLEKNPSPRRVIYGLLALGEVTGFTGRSDIGKGNIIAGMVVDMAFGKAEMGFKTHKGKLLRILIVTLEDRKVEVAGKLQGHLEARIERNGPEDQGLSKEALRERVKIMDGVTKPFSLFVKNPVTKQIEATPTRDFIFETIKEGRFDVVVFDPTVRLTTSDIDENDNGAGDFETRALKEMAGECDCAILAVSHTSQADGGTVRGASARHDAYRAGWYAFKPDETHCAALGIPKDEIEGYTAIQGNKGNIVGPKAKSQKIYRFGNKLFNTAETGPYAHDTVDMSYVFRHNLVFANDAMDEAAIYKLSNRLIEGLGERKNGEQPSRLFTAKGSKDGERHILSIMRELLPDHNDAELSRIVYQLKTPHPETGVQFLVEGKYLPRRERGANRHPEGCILPASFIGDDAFDPKHVKAVYAAQDQGNEIVWESDND